MRVADRRAFEKNIYEITENNSRCYNPKDRSTGKDRKAAFVRLRKEETLLPSALML